MPNIFETIWKMSDVLGVHNNTASLKFFEKHYKTF